MSRRHGFSFAEVMFAVVILGIGFIMVSAVFPVAAEQTRSNTDDATAALLARDMTATIASSTKADDYFDLDPTNNGITRAFADKSALLAQVSGNLISATDPRYACVPFFCTESGGTVRISLLIVRRWSHDAYTPADLSSEEDLEPRGININSITPQPGGTDTIDIAKDDAGMYQSVAPGSFIIIRKFNDGGSSSGRIFRVGSQQSETTDSMIWTLAFGFGLQSGESFGDAEAAVIGSDLANPADPAGPGNPYVGPAQDVGIYTTFVRPR